MKAVEAHRIIYPTAKGVGSRPDDNNDCTVRAVVNAFGFEYQKVHDVLEFYGRKTGHGAKNQVWIPAYKQLGMEPIGSYGKCRNAWAERYTFGCKGISVPELPGITIKSFLKKHPGGRFVCMSRRHAFAIVDGALIDHTNLLINTRITVAFKAVS